MPDLDPDIAQALGQALPGRASELSAPLGLLCAELLRWNKRINLTGFASQRQVWVGLFLDSLALLPHLRGRSLLDIGSGAGFPGLVLALARPDMAVTLLDARAKRVSFQKQAARLLGLDNLRAIQGRAGEGALPGLCYDTVTVKAVGSLPYSLELARTYLAPGGIIILPRGASTQEETRHRGLNSVTYQLPDPGGNRVLVLAGQADVSRETPGCTPAS